MYNNINWLLSAQFDLAYFNYILNLDMQCSQVHRELFIQVLIS